MPNITLINYKAVAPLFLASFLALTVHSQQLDHILGNIIFRIAPDVSLEQLSEDYRKEFSDPSIQLNRQLSQQLFIYLLTFDHNVTHERHLLSAMKSDPRVLAAQFNHVLEFRETFPDDPLFNFQWQWLNTGQSGGTANADIDMELAWDITTGGVTQNGDTIVIAIVDDGIDLSHPDFEGNLWVNHHEIPNNGIDDDMNGYTDDYLGWNTEFNNDSVDIGAHGVSVSGMAGAKGNDGIGVTGVNWHVKIMTVVYESVSEASAIEAYSYVLTQRMQYNATGGSIGAFVVASNSSWGRDFGQPEEAPLWCAFYDTLGAHGVLSVAATMNREQDVDVVGDLPTGCTSEFLISVTSTNRNDERATAAYGLESIDVAAPGQNVYTTRVNNMHGSSSGTSFASPTVAGLVGLLYAAPCNVIAELAMVNPPAAARLVRDAIYTGVDTLPALIDEIKYGGRINAFNAVNIIMENCGPCPKAVGLSVGQLTDITAELLWVGNDSIVDYDLIWKQVNAFTWDTIPGIGNQVFLNDLQACTQYEFQINGNCGDTSSAFTDSFLFETDGCCTIPESIFLIETGTDYAEVIWNDLLAARQYILEIRVDPDGEWTEYVSEEAYFIFDQLTSCTEYAIRLQTDCDTMITDFSEPLLFTTKGCGTCIDSTYCPALGEDVSDEWIETVEVNSYMNTSGANNGYVMFPGMGLELEKGETYPVTLTPGYSSFTFNEYFRLWIDLDQNGLFEDSTELLLDPVNAVNTTYSDSIFIPENALEGVTRMRIAMKFSGFGNSKPMACGEFSHGEVEDYCITITGNANAQCPKASDLDITVVKEDSAVISWEFLENAIGFNYRYRVKDGTDWNVEVTLDTSVILTGLEPCTEYAFQLLTICPQDTSGFSDTLFFKTECPNAVDEIPDFISQLRLYPNPFVEAFQVEFLPERSGEFQLLIHTIDGHLVYNDGFKVYEGLMYKHQFSEPSLTRGMYFVTLKMGGDLVTLKVLKLD